MGGLTLVSLRLGRRYNFTTRMQSDDAPLYRSPHRTRSSRGAWVIAAMFTLGGLVLAGLYLAPRPQSPRAPADAPWGLPKRPATVVLLPVGRATHQDAVREIRAAAEKPDIIMLVDVEPDVMLAIALEMGMAEQYQGVQQQRVARTAGGKPEVGVGLLARHPLYDVGPVGADSKHSHGVLATTVIDGSKFVLACTWSPLPEGGAAMTELDGKLATMGGPPGVIGAACVTESGAGYMLRIAPAGASARSAEPTALKLKTSEPP